MCYKLGKFFKNFLEPLGWSVTVPSESYVSASASCPSVVFLPPCITIIAYGALQKCYKLRKNFRSLKNVPLYKMVDLWEESPRQRSFCQ